MGEAKTPEEMYRRLSRGGGRKADPRLPPPLVPVDFGYWKLAPAGLGVLGLGVYAGFRKQVSRNRSSDSSADRGQKIHEKIGACAVRAMKRGSWGTECSGRSLKNNMQASLESAVPTLSPACLVLCCCARSLRAKNLQASSLSFSLSPPPPPLPPSLSGFSNIMRQQPLIISEVNSCSDSIAPPLFVANSPYDAASPLFPSHIHRPPAHGNAIIR